MCFELLMNTAELLNAHILMFQPTFANLTTALESPPSVETATFQPTLLPATGREKPQNSANATQGTVQWRL